MIRENPRKNFVLMKIRETIYSARKSTKNFVVRENPGDILQLERIRANFCD